MSKLPSGRFPFINLSKALDRAQAIYENDKGGKGLKVPVAFAAWGYSDKSSGGFQTVGALKGYGLLVDEGSNDDRAVKLTAEARQYFQTEMDSDKATLRATFASRPPLMAHLYEHWEGGTVDDPVARTYLKTSIGLNEQSARSALGIYKENLSFISHKANLKALEAAAEFGDSNSQDDGVVFGGACVGDLIQSEANGVLRFEKPKRVRLVQMVDGIEYVAVEGHETGIPMSEVIVQERAPAPTPAAPTFKLAADFGAPDERSKPLTGEAEWISNVVGRGRKVRLLVSGGDMGPKEISKLILLLEAQKAVLDDDEEDAN